MTKAPANILSISSWNNDMQYSRFRKYMTPISLVAMPATRSPTIDLPQSALESAQPVGIDRESVDRFCREFLQVTTGLSLQHDGGRKNRMSILGTRRVIDSSASSMESLDFVLRSNDQTPWRLDLPFRIDQSKACTERMARAKRSGQQFEGFGKLLIDFGKSLVSLEEHPQQRTKHHVSPTNGAISFGRGDQHAYHGDQPIPTQIPQNFMALILMSACSKIACRFPICEKISSKTLRESSNLPVNREVFAASAFAAHGPPWRSGPIVDLLQSSIHHLG